MRRLSSLRAAGGAGALWLALTSCSALPEIPEGECGNRVIEAGEDCDTLAVDGFECRPEGAIGACHFDCARRPDGAQGTCPADFGCGFDEVCRRATGKFDLLPESIPGNFSSLLSADFDGDGREDVVGLRPQALLGRTQIHVFYFDELGAPADRWTVAEALSNPAVFDGAGGDGRADLIGSASALAVLLGEADRTLSPDVRPSYHIPDSEVLVIPVAAQAVMTNSPLVVLIEHQGKLELHKPADATHLLAKLVDLPGSLATLAGGPTTGWLFERDEHPCLNVVLAQLGSRDVLGYQICYRDPVDGVIRFREQAIETRLTLPEGERVVSQPLIADVDGNGHNDLLVASDEALFVAFGDGTTLAPFVAHRLERHDPAVPPPEEPLPPFVAKPLAAGDLTGDGCADFVDRDRLLVSERLSGASGVGYRVAHLAVDPWSEALFADVTGDSLPDVVTALDGQPDLDFFVGTDSDRPNHLRVQTSYPASHLATGDFDGDRIGDVAFFQRGAGSSGDDQFSVSFGGSFASLRAPVAAGHIADGVDLATLTDNGSDMAADLIVMHRLVNDRGEAGAALSVLDGNAHRTFVSPIQLTSSNIAGELRQGDCIRVTTGHFHGKNQVDALAMAFSLPEDPDAPYALWLLPNLGFAGSTPRVIGWAFDEGLQPVIDRTSATARVTASFETGDVDGDGIDEAIAVAPSVDGARCLIQVAEVDAASAATSLRSSLVLEQPCVARPALRVVDIDLDGFAELVLMTGDAQVAGSILLLWNEPERGFDVRDLTLVVQEAEKPRAFDVYSQEPGAPPRIAYVNERGAYVVEARRGLRRFEPLGRVATLENATGITAGDLDGDGLVDLAVADSGKIRSLRAAVVSH